MRITKSLKKQNVATLKKIYKCKTKAQMAVEKYYVLKIINQQNSIFDVEEGFNEVLAQARMMEPHPNILCSNEIYVSQEEDSFTKKHQFRCAFLMEYCDSTLERFIKERCPDKVPYLEFSEEEVTNMLIQTLTGLSYLTNGKYFYFFGGIYYFLLFTILY